MSAPEGLESFSARLATFELPHRLPNRRASASKKKGTTTATWPKTAPAAEDMARAGFWFKPASANPDNACCFFCNSELDGWEPDDDPVVEHVTHAKHCGWAIHTDIRRRVMKGEHIEHDPYDEDMVEARTATFLGKWPHEGKKGWKPKTQKLVDAGWCYDPSPEADDGSTCFYCSLSLDGWEPKDDPWKEHKKRSPDCPFLGLAEKAKANKPKKGRKVRASTASRTSRMSTQSNMTTDIDNDSRMAVDESSLARDESVMALEIPTGKAKTTKGCKASTRASSSSKASTIGHKGGRTKKASSIEHTGLDLDFDTIDIELGPPDAEATPEPARKVARLSTPEQEKPPSIRMDVLPSSPIHEHELSEDQLQLHAEIAAYEASRLSQASSRDGLESQRGVKRMSDGSPKRDSADNAKRTGKAKAVPKAKTKTKKGATTKQVAQEDVLSLEMDAASPPLQVESGPRPQPTPQGNGEGTSVSDDARPQSNAPAEQQLHSSPQVVATGPADTPSPRQGSSVSPAPPTPTPMKVAPPSLHRSSPIRPRVSNVRVFEDGTPAASPHSSDAENVPPSSRPNALARKALASLSSNPRAVQVALAASTPTNSPSKRNFVGGTKSSFPWQAADLENIFVPSPTSKKIGRSSGFGFGNATHLSDKEKASLAALDHFAVEHEADEEMPLGEVVERVKAALTSPEKKMTVEQWVAFNAVRGEERLRGECERMVGIFEREGGRALQTLQGLECQS